MHRLKFVNKRNEKIQTDEIAHFSTRKSTIFVQMEIGFSQSIWKIGQEKSLGPIYFFIHFLGDDWSQNGNERRQQIM